jgi:hypothetical protein
MQRTRRDIVSAIEEIGTISSIAFTCCALLDKAFVEFLPDRQGHRAVGNPLFQGLQSQLPVIEQALETAALMLGSDKSRGYCLEMICADFLAGVSLETGKTDALLPSLTRLVLGLPKPQIRLLLEMVQVTL